MGVLANGIDQTPAVLPWEFQTRLRVLAAGFARALLVSPPSWSKKAQGRPGAGWHPRSAARRVEKWAHSSIQVGRTSGLPCAMALRLMPSSPRGALHYCPRRLANGDALRPVGPAASSLGLTVALDGQDHPVLPYAAARMSPQGFPARARGRKNVGETSLQRRSSARGFGLTGLAALPAPLAPTLPRPPHPRLATRDDDRSPLLVSRDGRNIRQSRISVNKNIFGAKG